MVEEKGLSVDVKGFDRAMGYKRDLKMLKQSKMVVSLSYMLILPQHFKKGAYPNR